MVLASRASQCEAESRFWSRNISMKFQVLYVSRVVTKIWSQRAPRCHMRFSRSGLWPRVLFVNAPLWERGSGGDCWVDPSHRLRLRSRENNNKTNGFSTILIEVIRKYNKTIGFSYILSWLHENIHKTQCFSILLRPKPSFCLKKTCFFLFILLHPKPSFCFNTQSVSNAMFGPFRLRFGALLGPFWLHCSFQKTTGTKKTTKQRQFMNLY